MPGLRRIVFFLRLLIEDRQRFALENVALRYELAVLKRSVNRPRIHDSDRMFWILLRQTAASVQAHAHGRYPSDTTRCRVQDMATAPIA